MKYVGSKRRIAPYLKPIIESFLTPTTNYYEPFVGGANMMEFIDHPRRAGSDSHYYLIEMLKAVRDGWLPPENVSEELYQDIRLEPTVYPPALVGSVGFACSFGAKWWGGYARSWDKNGNPRNYAAEQRRHLMKQAPKLKGCIFVCRQYHELNIVPGSVVYCDPPYNKTLKYSVDFNSAMFWEWVREKSKTSVVLVSEYEAPDDFEEIWVHDKGVVASFDAVNRSKTAVEKLFRRKQ